MTRTNSLRTVSEHAAGGIQRHLRGPVFTVGLMFKYGGCGRLECTEALQAESNKCTGQLQRVFTYLAQE